MKSIIVDTRQKQGKHDLKHSQLQNQGFKLIFEPLKVGDYMVKGGNISVDTKQDLGEISSNLYHDLERFQREALRAKKLGIKLIILIEHGENIKTLADVRLWKNKHSKVHGTDLAKKMQNFYIKYGVKFLFCDKSDTAKEIVKLLNLEESQ